MVARASQQGRIDAVADLADPVPVNVIAELLGSFGFVAKAGTTNSPPIPTCQAR